jgi:c-di-AMP phosphodiesterase-like protein
MLQKMPMPYALLDEKGMILWSNEAFVSATGKQSHIRTSIVSVFTDLEDITLPDRKEKLELEIDYKDAHYHVELNRLFGQLSEDSSPAEFDQDKNVMYAMMLRNDTENLKLKKDIEDIEAVIGLLYVDNYEETLEVVDDVKRSLTSALLDRKINLFMEGIDAVVKKISKDKYIFVLRHKYMAELQASRFPVLDEIRAINVTNDAHVTISIGIGVEHESLEKSFAESREAIELALMRGGDQVVIKENGKILYFGGKTASVERSTRVKARVKAQAMKEVIAEHDKILVMGHKMGDIDCFGAAVGIWRIAITLNKPCHIVLDNVTATVRPIANLLTEDLSDESTRDMIISSEHGLEIIDENTLLVIVDINKAKMTECPELIDKAGHIIVIDHHRQTEDAIDNAVLSYIEPFASSSSEMLAELIQYIGEGLQLKAAEADALYAGIMIDTNNFAAKAGVRTFEAAAYLKRNGVDITKIRRLFRPEMGETKAKANAMACAEVFMENYAFTEFTVSDEESPTELAAQVADELLDIDAIRASFVFMDYLGKVYISARSIDDVNVQVIMEKLGGGGHLGSAGAQLVGVPVDEAIAKVQQIITQMAENKEI